MAILKARASWRVRPTGRMLWLPVMAAVLLVAALLAHVTIDDVAATWCKNNTRRWSRADAPRAFEQLGKSWVPLWFVLLYVWATGRRRVLLVVALALLLTGVSVTVTKASVPRIRPKYRFRPPKSSYSRASFPSGDAAAAFATAAAVGVFVPLTWRVFMLSFASMVGLLRVLSLRHYPADALAGAAFGLLSAWGAVMLARKLSGRAPPMRAVGAKWLTAIIFVLPCCSPLISKNPFARVLSTAGVAIAALLLIFKGPAWLRWLRGLRRLHEKDAPTAKRRGRLALLVLLGLLAMVILPALSRTYLYDRDEGYYAECGREMLERGDPFVPHFNGRPWLEKPPLTYWLMALAMKIFGATEFAVRLPSALAGLLAVALTYSLGRRMYSPFVGIIAGAALGTSVFFTVTMRWALMDNPLVCCVLISMIGLWILLEDGRARGAWLFWAGCGLGGLAKGPLGFALPVIALAGTVLWTRRWRLLRQLRLPRGLLLALAIIGVWAIPANWLTRGDYFHQLVWVRTLRPILIPLQGHAGGNVVEYLALLPAYIPILLIGLFPWSVFLISGAHRIAEGERRGPRIGLLGGWALAQFIVLSLVRTKMPHHVLPLVPPIAIAIGAFLASIAAGHAPLVRRWGPWSRGALMLGWLALAAAALAVPVNLGFAVEWPWFLPAALAAVAGGIWTLLAARRDVGRTVVAIFVTALLAFGLFWQLGLPRPEHAKATHQIVNFLERTYGRDGLGRVRLGRMRFKEVSLLFYTRKTVQDISTRADLAHFLGEPGPAVVVLSEKRWAEELENGLGLSAHVLWRRSVWMTSKGGWRRLVIVSNGPVPKRVEGG